MPARAPAEKLKPCPFCRADGAAVERIVDYYAVVCANGECGAAGPMRKVRAETGPAWNRRDGVVAR